MAAFEKHIAHVTAVIPRKQLLIFEAGKNSYTELAKFLGAEIPAGKDYPRVNSRAEFSNLVYGLTAAAAAVVLVPLLILGCALRYWFHQSGAGAVSKARRKGD